MQRQFVALVGLLCLFLSASAAQSAPIPIGDTLRLDIDGQYRLFYDYMTDFALDEEGKTLGDPKWGNLHNRLRLAPSFHVGQTFSIFGQIDFLGLGRLYGVETDVGKNFQAINTLPSQVEGFVPVDPRHLWMQWISPVGAFRLGQQPSHWGLGMLANNGQTQTGEFAAPRFGDVVERLLWLIPIAAPFTSGPIAQRLFVGAGFDIVFRDENADLSQGDLAFQGAFSLFYRKNKDVFAGVYAAVRRQRDRDGRRIDVQAFDLFVKFSRLFAKGKVGFDFALEGAFLTGTTTRVLNELGKDGLGIEAMGAIGRFNLQLPKAGVRIGLELGFASGDNDTTDSVSRTFRFDPDYQPSMILFRRALGAITARGADRTGDLTRVGVAPPGTDQIPSFGQVGNVLYIQPVVAYRPFANLVQALKKTELKVGVLFARAAADLADPFASFRNGGVNFTSFGKPSASAQDMGVEINVSLTLHYDIWKTISIKLVLLYGHLFAGAALTDANGNGANIDMFQARLITRF